MAATNTLTGVNLAAIAEMTLDALRTLRIPFSAFTTDFSSDIASFGESVTTRYVTDPTVQDFSNTSRNASNSVTTARTVTLNKYVGVDIGFSDTETSFSSVKLAEMYVPGALGAIVEDLYANIFARVTISNFSSNTQIAAANFTAANVAGLNKSMNTSKVPVNPRHIIIDPSYANTLKKDSGVSASYAYGSNEAIKDGVLPRVYGFNIHEFNGTIPNNSQNLAGFALHPQALLVASRAPKIPAPWYGEAINVTDPDSGLTVQLRRFYDDVQERTQMCVIYGTQIGNPGNLHRIKYDL